MKIEKPNECLEISKIVIRCFQTKPVIVKINKDKRVQCAGVSLLPLPQSKMDKLPS